MRKFQGLFEKLINKSALHFRKG